MTPIDFPGNRRSLQFLLGNFEEYTATAEGSERIMAADENFSLLDAVYGWLEYGDGYLWCQTFESLLIFVIYLADDHCSERGTLGIELWMQGEARKWGVQCILTPPKISDELRHAPLLHPVLDKHEFDMGLRRACLRRSAPELFVNIDL